MKFVTGNKFSIPIFSFKIRFKTIESNSDKKIGKNFLTLPRKKLCNRQNLSFWDFRFKIRSLHSAMIKIETSDHSKTISNRFLMSKLHYRMILTNLEHFRFSYFYGILAFFKYSVFSSKIYAKTHETFLKFTPLACKIFIKEGGHLRSKGGGTCDQGGGALAIKGGGGYTTRKEEHFFQCPMPRGANRGGATGGQPPINRRSLVSLSPINLGGWGAKLWARSIQNSAPI